MTINTRWIRLGLSLLGVGGVGLTSWLSIKCHEKAKDKTETKDKAVAYIPAIASGVATAGCILGSHHLSSKEIAALTASCGYLAANRKKVEKLIREKFGEEKLLEVKKEAREELAKENVISPVKIEHTGHGNIHFVESICNREFYCSKAHVKWAFDILNAMFRHGDTINMNTLYELLGLSKTKEGFEWGWPDDEEEPFGYSIDTAIFPMMTDGLDENGNPMVWLDISTRPPSEIYLEV